MDTTIPYALIYLLLNAFALLGVIPWIRLRKQYGFGLRVTDKTRLPHDKIMSEKSGLVRGALVGFGYVMLAVIAPFSGIYGLVTMVSALGGDITLSNIITAEILVAGAAIGLFAAYCFLQIAKESPDFGRDSGGGE